jgi:hypothetical protein
MSEKTSVSATTTMELRMQQLTTDLQGLQAELERLLVEKRFQAKQLASLTDERDHLAQQHAAAISSTEQAMRIIDSLRARLEEASAERAVLQSSYERSKAENSALQARLETTAARLGATAAELGRSSDRLQAILASRGWRLLSVYYRCRKALSRFRPRFVSDEHLIARSGLFDASWYLVQYPDVQRAGIDPLKHYLQDGAAAGIPIPISTRIGT